MSPADRGRVAPLAAPAAHAALIPAVTATVECLGGPTRGDETWFRCPAHDDHHPSASWNAVKGVWTCFACGARGGTLDLARRLGLGDAPVTRSVRRAPSPTAFTPNNAQRVWRIALARARDNEHAEHDEAVYAYLARRHLAEAWEESAFGVLHPRMPLPAPVAWWPTNGYRLVAPLFDLQGHLVSVQARCIGPTAKKTLFPRGAQAKGCAFATRTGRQLLRGAWRGPPIAVLGEGLTDSLALAIATAVPALTVPGVMQAETALGAWVAGLDLYLALDTDEPGERRIDAVAACAYRLGARRVLRVRWPAGAKDACAVLDALGSSGLAEFLEAQLR